MRNSILLITCLFFTLTCSSQPTFSAVIADTPAITTSLRVAENLDILTSSQTKKYIAISRFTHDGELKWSKIFKSDNDIAVARVAATSDNGFIIAGFNNLYTHIFLIRCSYTGKIIWQKKILKNYNSFASSVRVCGANDGSIYIATSNMKDFNEIFRFNKDGQLAWRKCYAVKSYRGDTVLSITSGKDNSVTVGIGAAYCVKYCSRTILQQFDKNGNLRFSKISDTTQRSSVPLEPVMLLDDGYNIQAVLYSKPVPYDGRFKYVDFYAVMNYYPEKQNAIAITVRPAGDLLLNNLRNRYDFLLKTVTGNNSTNLFMPDGSLYKINVSSSSVVLQKYDSLNSVCGNIPYWKTGIKSIINLKMIDLPFASITDTISLTENNFTFANDAKPNVYCTNKTSSSNVYGALQHINNPVIKLYPNPAKNNIEIDGLSSAESTSLILLNTQSIILNKATVHGKSYSFNTSNLPKGIYFVRVTNDAITKTLSFIKE